ncbi:MAG: hypothetical protein ACRDPX_02145 [Gaiellaceae bacterium]
MSTRTWRGSPMSFARSPVSTDADEAARETVVVRIGERLET